MDLQREYITTLSCPLRASEIVKGVAFSTKNSCKPTFLLIHRNQKTVCVTVYVVLSCVLYFPLTSTVGTTVLLHLSAKR